MFGFVKKEKVSILFAIVVCAIAAFCCVARYFPTNVGQIYDIDASSIVSLEKEDVLSLYNCELDDENNYKILGGDPQLTFSSQANGIKAAKLNLSKEADTTISFEVYVALEGESFTAEKCYAGCVFKGETGAVISIPNGNYRSIRLDIDADDSVVYKSLELYDQEAVVVPYTPATSSSGYVFTVLISLASAVIAFFANKRLRWCECAAKTIKENAKKIALFLGLTLAAIPGAAFVEWVLCNVERQGVFNAYRWLFFFGALELVITFVLLRNQFAEKPEKLFLAAALIMGLIMLFGTPIKHICWDLDSHYPWAVHSSYSDMAYLTGADVAIDRVAPQSLLNTGFSLENYESDLAYITSLDGMVVKQAEAQFSIAHLPAGIVLAVARKLGASFVVRYTLGRISYLLVYVFVCYFAIKKIKSGKMILTTICLFPTVLFMATNYAYDSWVVAFSILGMAYFMNILQEPEKPIKVSDTVIMCAAFALAALPKLVYILLMGIPFFAYKKWQNKKEFFKYYSILITVFTVVFAIFAITSLTKVSGGGDTRGGNVNPGGQISFILSNPIEYAKILIKFLRQYLSIDGMRNYISNFAYFGVGKWWPVFVVLLGITAVTDTKDGLKFKIPLIIKILSVLFFVGMAALIATALYIDFTPVGNGGILGCQPRYIIPLLAPLLLLVTGQRKNIIKEKNVYNGFIILTATAATMSDVYFSMISRMV
ncbi:MAG: DUF2142 domain-containing protein [Clostridia bacterium]|nr:DUF2142 domain-containing protein [Clostridia bacterium]